MEVQTAVNESVVNQIIPGQRVSTTFEALPNVILTGRAVSISQIPTRVEVRSADDMTQPPMDTGVRFFTVIVKLDSVTDQLKPGMSVEANIITREKPDALLVPADAIQGNAVFVIEGAHVRRREVKIGIRGTRNVEILSGLTEGERVASSAATDLKDGSRVRVHEPQAPPS